jgi:hypothetical protein
MTKTWICGSILAVALVMPAITVAHQGHPHQFMGTISSFNDTELQVRTTDGKTVVFTLGAKTVYQRAKVKVDAKSLKAGERVVVSALEVPAGKVMTAQTVQLAAPVNR